MVHHGFAAAAVALAILFPIAAPALRAAAGETPRTQIVLQWLTDDQNEISLDRVWAIEDRLEAESEGLFDVDGHAPDPEHSTSFCTPAIHKPPWGKS